MRYDPRAATETIMTWKRNYKIIRNGKINIGIFTFECCTYVTQDKVSKKRKPEIFLKTTFQSKRSGLSPMCHIFNKLIRTSNGENSPS